MLQNTLRLQRLNQDSDSDSDMETKAAFSSFTFTK